MGAHSAAPPLSSRTQTQKWCRHAKTQIMEVHFLQGNQSTPCLRLEQPKHTAGTSLPLHSGREESQPLHHPPPRKPLAQGRHRDGAEGEWAPFLPFIPYPAQTSQDNLLRSRESPCLARLSQLASLSQDCSHALPKYGRLAP